MIYLSIYLNLYLQLLSNYIWLFSNIHIPIPPIPIMFLALHINSKPWFGNGHLWKIAALRSTASVKSRSANWGVGLRGSSTTVSAVFIATNHSPTQFQHGCWNLWFWPGFWVFLFLIYWLFVLVMCYCRSERSATLIETYGNDKTGRSETHWKTIINYKQKWL